MELTSLASREPCMGHMVQVVAWVFRHTGVDTFVVPPHRRNVAAERVYEKAGFRLLSMSLSYPGHRVMLLRREQFETHADVEAA